METMELIRLARAGDKLARERLTKENMGLVYSIVRRFIGRGYEKEDLCQIGAIGLIKAIDNFDLSYDVKFSTYAVPMITGEIKRFLRDDGMIKVSRSLKETAIKARAITELLRKEMGREPTILEISRRLGVSAEEITVAMEAVTEVESLNRTIYQGDGSPIYLMDKIVEKGSMENDIVDKVALEHVLKTLEESEQEIIYLRYFQEKTQTDIANRLGISQVQVSRLEKRILNRMKERLIG